jgi:peptidoglycan/LPS O-acetylase OafA/YrhL
MELRTRSVGLDNLRALVVALVVVMHSNVTYSGMGMWYYVEGDPRRLGQASRALFGLYGCFTQAWFMGLLFFLSGLLAVGALARRGPGAFTRERLFRLGAPLLVFMLVIHPLTVYFRYGHGLFLHSMGLGPFYAGYLRFGKVLSGTGPLWFVEALLLFCLAYALFRSAFPADAGRRAGVPPGAAVLVGLVLLIAAGAFLIRLVWPIGTAFLNLQFSFFSSYIALFILGVRAGEGRWLESLPAASVRRWLGAGLMGIPTFLVLMAAIGVKHGGLALIGGGPHWQAAAFALWESFVAVAMTVGLVGWFRGHGARDNRFTRFCRANSFRVYMFHTPVLVGLAMALAAWHAPMLAKHAVVAPLAYFITLALAGWGLRRIPGLEPITR